MSRIMMYRHSEILEAQAVAMTRVRSKSRRVRNRSRLDLSHVMSLSD